MIKNKVTIVWAISAVSQQLNVINLSCDRVDALPHPFMYSGIYSKNIRRFAAPHFLCTFHVNRSVFQTCRYPGITMPGCSLLPLSDLVCNLVRNAMPSKFYRDYKKRSRFAYRTSLANFLQLSVGIARNQKTLVGIPYHWINYNCDTCARVKKYRVLSHFKQYH